MTMTPILHPQDPGPSQEPNLCNVPQNSDLPFYDDKKKKEAQLCD